MRPSPALAPIFGVLEPHATYVARRAAYAVIQHGDMFAAVRSEGGYFLPGGGCYDEESFEQALRREVREELGYELISTVPLGRAVQYFYAASEGTHFKTEAAFFEAQLERSVSSEAELVLEWLPRSGSEALLFHASHWWAVQQAFNACVSCGSSQKSPSKVDRVR